MSISREYHIIDQAAILVRAIDAARHPIILDELYTSYNAIVDELDALRAPMRRGETFGLLPTELKHRIFQEVCSTSRGGPLLLSQVCRQWRNLVHHSSDLWANIAIDTSGLDWMKLLGIYAFRSAERLLDITVYVPVGSAEINDAISYVPPRRWKSFTLLSGRPSAERPPRMWLPRFTNGFLYSPGDLVERNAGTALLRLFETQDFPNLNRIDVQIESAIGYVPDGCMWSNFFPSGLFKGKWGLSNTMKSALLTHLSVLLTYAPGSSAWREDLGSSVANAPGLEYLDLVVVRVGATLEQPSFPHDQPNVALGRLKKLKITDCNIFMLLGLDCPNLEILTASTVTEELSILTRKLSTFSSLNTLSLNIYGGPCVVLVPSDVVSIPIVNLTIEHWMSGSRQYEEWTLDALYSFLERFPSVIRLDLSSQGEFFDWARAIRTFPCAEHVSIRHVQLQPRQGITNLLNAPPGPEQPRFVAPHSVVCFPSLYNLRVDGKPCKLALSAIFAPELKELAMVGARDLPFSIFTSFLRNSPCLVKLHLEGIHTDLDYPKLVPSTTSQSICTILADELPPALPLTIQDLRITHDAMPILRNVSIPHVRKLSLMGVRKIITNSNDNPDYPEIRLSSLLHHPDHLLANVTVLDLCSITKPPPIVIGINEVLPRMKSLQHISLPRAPPGSPSADVLVDLLIKEMAREDRGAYICPRLTEISTQDYPHWERLLQLLSQRNRTAHRRPGQVLPAPLECLRLPALPHSSILTRLRMGLAGKFPPRRKEGTEDIPAKPSSYYESFLLVPVQSSSMGRLGCDDCVLTGWKCSAQGLERESNLRLSCARHKRHVVRVTAGS